MAITVTFKPTNERHYCAHVTVHNRREYDHVNRHFTVGRIQTFKHARTGQVMRGAIVARKVPRFGGGGPGASTCIKLTLKPRTR